MKIKHITPVARTVRNITLLFAFALITAVSCKTQEGASTNTNVRRLNDKEAQELLISKDSTPFWFFTSKIGVEITSTKQSNSFNATVKMKVDSAFSGTMTVAAFIGATYLINTDSVYFVDKQNKCYVKQNFSALSEMFGTDIEYAFFQDLILGLPVGLDPDIKYKHKNTKEYYILMSDKKKKEPKHDKNENKDEKDNNDENKDENRDNNRDDNDRGGPEDRIIVQYYINTETWLLDRITIEVPSDGVEIDINFLNRQVYENFTLPEQTTIKIVHPDDEVSIVLDYGNVKFNERKEIDINIPESYEECKPKEE